jgi:hypothetical protein
LSRTISLTAKVYDKQRMASESKKKMGIDFTYDTINVAKILICLKKNDSVMKFVKKTKEMMMYPWNVLNV